MTTPCASIDWEVQDMDVEATRQRVAAKIEANAQPLIELSRTIHQHPEIGGEEHRSVQALTRFLEEHSIPVESPYAGIETAFRATVAGRTLRPRVALLAEYDALPGIGHACGHNVICAMSVGAAVGLKEVFSLLDATAEVIGCPAEETRGAKVDLLEQGAFSEVDFAMMLHPAPVTAIKMKTLALEPLEFTFHGRSAHAAQAPHQGVNALNAVILLFNHIDALRQHVKSDVRMHGIITDGGQAPNIVPERAQARFYLRAPDRDYLRELRKRVENCAEAAALATGSRLEVRRFENSFDNILTNPVLADAMRRNFEGLGETVIDEMPDGASTDMGNVSQVVPSIHGMICIAQPGTSLHSREFAQAAGSETGNRAVILGAKVLALTALDMLTDRSRLTAMTEAFQRARIPDSSGAYRIP
jgi:amidohydrolase